MTRDVMKRTAAGVAVALVLAAGLYFGGRWEERRKGAAEGAERIEQVEAARAELGRAQTELALAEDRTRLYRARSLLFEAAVDLDRRNFGTANEHLAAAARQLDGVLVDGSGPAVEALRALQGRIEATDVSVATDLGTQRSRILEYVALLDELLDGGEAAR